MTDEENCMKNPVCVEVYVYRHLYRPITSGLLEVKVRNKSLALLIKHNQILGNLETFLTSVGELIEKDFNDTERDIRAPIEGFPLDGYVLSRPYIKYDDLIRNKNFDDEYFRNMRLQDNDLLYNVASRVKDVINEYDRRIKQGELKRENDKRKD